MPAGLQKAPEAGLLAKLRRQSLWEEEHDDEAVCGHDHGAHDHQQAQAPIYLPGPVPTELPLRHAIRRSTLLFVERVLVREPVPHSPSFKMPMPTTVATPKATWPMRNSRDLTPVTPPLEFSHSSVDNTSRSIASRMGLPTSATRDKTLVAMKMFTDGIMVSIQAEAHVAKLAATMIFFRDTRSETTPQNGNRNAWTAYCGEPVAVRMTSKSARSLIT
mmetsp:Transcript_46455/g.129242  ORF Transcript_46455/g.129242 Transcript_46455/m.129242 type:complete len:218 (+) Transcript_46455:1300-1953(+)